MTTDAYSVFGNKIRVRLILCLSKKSKNVSELILNCGLSQSAVSQHLGKLKRAGFVQTSKSGKEIYYSLTHRESARIAELIMKMEKDSV
jgi:DNA-binding transcriptional ArsR family regulator